MDLLNGYLMDRRFGLTEFSEDGDGVVPRALPEIRGFDHLDYVGKVAVLLLLFGGHVKFGGADAAALHFLERDGCTGVERMNGARDGVAVSPGIRQSTDDHIAAKPGKGVEI